MIRKLFLSLLVLGFLLFACRPKILIDNFETPTPEKETTISTLTPPQVTEDGNLDGWREPEIYQAGLINSQQVNLASLQSANEYHLDLNVLEDRSSVTIQQQVLMTNREDIPLEDLYFHVFANYNGGRITFNKITIDDQEIDYQMEAEDTILHILLQEALPKGRGFDCVHGLYSDHSHRNGWQLWFVWLFSFGDGVGYVLSDAGGI